MNTNATPPLPSAVIFDLGRVMVDFDYGRGAQGLAALSAVDTEEVRRWIDQSTWLIQLETGLITEQEFFEVVSRGIQFRGSFNDFARIFGDIFEPIHEMIHVQSQLIARGIPTYAFSNTNGLAVAHIQASYPFFNRFTDTVCSHNHKSMKPHSTIYEVLERVSGKRGADLIYLDDRLENVEAGAARGWQTIHVTHAPSAASELARRFALP
jgi:FMN phosphatase YigB (HAD superfamily)